MKTLLVQAVRPYSIYIAPGLLDSSFLVEKIRPLGHRFVIISDSQVAELLGEPWLIFLCSQGLTVGLIKFPSGEAFKTRQTKQQLEDELFLLSCQRDTVILALGGGVVTDLAGFVAATYYRGIPVVYIPTSLLAMVDASIGGKTAVDTPYGKNLIGAFSSPRDVFIDPSLLQSLPERELRNGAVEMIKHALIADPDLFLQLQQQREAFFACDPLILQDLIERNCQIKRHVVEIDEMEQGLRQLLNFGHTIGHAIENLDQYQIQHGEAVAIGLILESFLSHRRGYLSAENLKKIQEIIFAYGVNLQTTALQDENAFWQALTYDKKAKAGQVQVVMLDDIGKPHHEQNQVTVSISREEIAVMLRESASLLNH